MRLSQLAAAVSLDVTRDVEIAGLADTTTDVSAGALFFCVPGARRDGHDFAEEAIARGATALVVDRPLNFDVPQLVVPKVRAAMGPIAAEFHGRPGSKLILAGITGTNGKTTTAHILTSVLNAAGISAETIGTLSGQYTSPPPLQLHRTLREFKDSGAQAVVMEVSSHALDQHRVDGLVFDVVAFTNLSQDHLDYHHTMEEYFEVKASLFEDSRAEYAIINGDDPWGDKLASKTTLPSTVYRMADVEDLSFGPSRTTFAWRARQVDLPLIGMFNVSNALAAATAASQLGVSNDVIAEALSNLQPVPGRVEQVMAGQDFVAIVDFAHTPDGLEKVLDVARNAAGDRKVIVVFGCGGDRDAGKRPLMAKIAEAHADNVVVTSDNPRSESPETIIDDIKAGFSAEAVYSVELDRAKAIALAVSEASAGDVVVVAGKGHEVTQEINGVKTPFDDRAVLRQAIDKLERAS